MAWGVEFEPTFGQFGPQGVFVGWREERIAYFNAGLTEAEEAAIDPNNKLASHMVNVSDKFKKDRGPVFDHEWPKEYRTERALKQFGAIIQVNERLLIVEDGLRALIEEFEPGVHQFNPIEMTTKGGKIYPGGHHVLVISQFIDCFSVQDSDPKIAKELWPGMDPMMYSIRLRPNYKAFEVLALRDACHAGKHLWRETMLTGPDFFMSDDLHEAILEADFKFPKHARLKDV